MPSSEDIKLSGGAVELEAVFLYADMADSSKLAQKWKQKEAARTIRSFLDAVTRVIRSEKGEIRSFDGDRVMGIFVGGNKCTAAARCALKINYAVRTILHEELDRKYNDYPESFRIDHCTGVALGKTLLVRGGVRDNNDLISVGSAPNVAAKLSSVRSSSKSYITEDVYNLLADESKYGGDENRAMWSRQTRTVAGRSMTVYGSTWWWKP